MGMMRWTLLTIGLLIAFAGGFFVGQHFKTNDDLIITVSSAAPQSGSINTVDDSAQNSENRVNNSTNTNTPSVDTRSMNNELSDKKVDADVGDENPILPAQDGDVVALFEQLIALQSSTTDYKEYGKKIDQIRLLLSNSDTEIALISEYFETLPADSTESYLIVSVLQGLADEKGKEALVQIAQKARANGDKLGTTQFLEIVGRTGIVTTEITRSLKEIALFDDEMQQSLYALDMLMPFQLSRFENQQVLTRLQEMNTDVEDQGYKNYLFNQIIRFSDSEQRSQLAFARLNDQSSSIENKSIVMDYIEQGQIDRTPETRELLMQIAQEQNNPLQIKSIRVLMSSFNLSQNEYQQLVEDQGIAPFNLR